MRLKNYLPHCSAILAISFAIEASAQPAAREPAFSPADRAELNELLERFEPRERPDLSRASLAELRVMLNTYREYTFDFSALVQFEVLTVCEVQGDSHLAIGDKIYLTRVGNSANLRMEVVRHEGQPDESHPWKGPGGGSDVITLNPSITGKKPNGAARKFTPEAVGEAWVNPHTGGTPENHSFSMRRDTRVIFPNPCNSPPGNEDMKIYVPEHPDGGRHGGHAVAN